jgi:hypothetical protein
MGRARGAAVFVDMVRAKSFIQRGRCAPPVFLGQGVRKTVDRRKGQVVELRFFRGLSVDETAEARQVSADTVMRDWHFAKAWLQNHELRREAR